MKIIFTLFVAFLIFGCAGQQQNLSTNNQQQTSQPVVDYSLDSQLDNLTNQIVESLTQKQKSKIAVIEFSDLDGNITEFGKYLSEELITRLFLTNRFEVVERNLLNKILEEHKLNMSGLVDENTIKELGRLLGVDAIASGSITDLGENIKVNARLISTETGSVFSVASAKIEKDETVRVLLDKISSSSQFLTKSKKEKQTISSSIKKEDVFFKEDFSEVDVGMIPINWIGGEKLMVASDQRQKYLTPFEKDRNHNFSVYNVNFPDNFKFEWIINTPPPGWWAHSLSIGNVTVLLHENGKRITIGNTTQNINSIAGKLSRYH